MVKLFLSQTHSAYDLLALVLREEYALPALPVIARTDTGKPWFPGLPDLHFNLSHSGGLALCGVGDEPMGVDVERIRPRRAALPRYALTAAEHTEYAALGGRWEDFYVLWTRREAWCKFTGLGVARSRGLEIPPTLEIRTFSGDGWRASACSVGGIGDLIRR